MNCLHLDQVYLYLEEELSPSEKSRVEEHLASCPKCQAAVEERRLLHQASDSLPLWEPPPDFTNQVMARLFPVRMSIRNWITVSVAGFSLTAFALFIYLILSGQSLAKMLPGALSVGLRLLECG